MAAALGYVLTQRTDDVQPDDAQSTAQVMREDSHVLDAGGAGSVRIVEFLDFECEVCAAFYPIVEDLRDEYAGRITYVVRYLPLPGHENSATSALAAQAAAEQGRFEDMYHLLLSRQAEWGEVTQSQSPIFRGYAEELGLDMDAYDASVTSTASLERVKADFDEATALGVTGAPTFFVDDKQLVLRDFDDLEAAIVDALDDGK
nr:thioredoxin domain-containing protein [Microbacterium sp. NC79]